MDNPLRHVLFTFDYELFLGSRSGTVDQCLISPTRKILSVLYRHRAKAIFFVDTTYLVRLNEIRSQYEPADRDWHKIVEQIRVLRQNGHEVFPHLHPHWLDAVYLPELNEWDLSHFIRYRFNSLNGKERSALWESSSTLLDEIIHPVDEHYQSDGYRAGGWCIQPFADFKPFFESYHIRYEFSVLPGFKQMTTAHQYDFINSPEKPVYHFSEDPLIEEEDGPFTEFTISRIGLIRGMDRLFNRILFKMILNKRQEVPGKGFTVSAKALDPDADYWVSNTIAEMVSLENLTLAKLRNYINFLKGNVFMQFLSHPKLLNDHHIYCFQRFLKRAERNFILNTDFRKIGSLE